MFISSFFFIDSSILWWGDYLILYCSLYIIYLATMKILWTNISFLQFLPMIKEAFIVGQTLAHPNLIKMVFLLLEESNFHSDTVSGIWTWFFVKISQTQFPELPLVSNWKKKIVFLPLSWANIYTASVFHEVHGLTTTI